MEYAIKYKGQDLVSFFTPSEGSWVTFDSNGQLLSTLPPVSPVRFVAFVAFGGSVSKKNWVEFTAAYESRRLENLDRLKGLKS